jgi:CubicO group peptidase (beta-lactamase class C family)
MTTRPALVAHRTSGVRRAAAIAWGVLALLLAIGCSGPTPHPKPNATPVDWQALGAAVETAIQGESQGLDNIRAIVVSVDGKTQLEHYRNGFSADDRDHVWSVTKSVIATLIGIAIDDGLISSVDQKLSVLLPEHRTAMTPTASRVTLRQLMSMSGGFAEEDWSLVLYERDHADGDDFIDYLLKLGPRHEPGTSFEYSNTSAHLATAVLASALARSNDPPKQTLLDYARANLFDPLGIRTEPAYTGNISIPFPETFARAGFGWLTDPNNLPYGGFGLRLTPSDMIKIGELYRSNGLWHGVQIVPREWVQQVLEPSTLNQEYGLLWWITTGPDTTPAYGASGAYGQAILVWPSRHAVIVCLTASPPDADHNLNVEPILDVIATALPRLS